MKLLTPEETSAKIGGINMNTLANWRSHGAGPPFCKVGGAIRYPEHLVDEWLQSRINLAGLAESHNAA